MHAVDAMRPRLRNSWDRRHALSKNHQPNKEPTCRRPRRPCLPKRPIARCELRPRAVAVIQRLHQGQGFPHRSGSRSSRTDRGYYWRISAELARHSPSCVQCCSHAPLTIGSVIRSLTSSPTTSPSPVSTDRLWLWLLPATTGGSRASYESRAETSPPTALILAGDFQKGTHDFPSSPSVPHPCPDFVT